MRSGPSEPRSPGERADFVVRRFLRRVLSRVRRAFGIAAQMLQRDELGELRHETRALGSASAESVSHVGAELREINERLSRLERDVARLVEATGPEGESPGESSPQSLTTD